MSSYIANLKQISGNIILLYKNFFHWNISKICIFLYENIVAFVLSLPFVGVMVYQYFASYSKLNESVSMEAFIIGNIGSIILTIVLLLCIVAIFLCMYTYGNFLMQNVYKSYLEGKRLPYTENLYFSWKHFRAYMGVLGWMSLYLLAPIGIALILLVGFGVMVEVLHIAPASIFVGIVSFLLFFALFVWFVHLMIRLIFSYYNLLYAEKVEKSKAFIDESFRLTKKKVWKIIFLILPFVLIIGFIASVSESAQNKISTDRIYNALRIVQQESGQDDHKLLEGFYSGTEDEKETFVEIGKNFKPKTNDIDRDFLSASLEYINVDSIDSNSGIFTLIFVVLSFLFLEGIASMLYLSVYHVIKAKDEENSWSTTHTN